MPLEDQIKTQLQKLTAHFRGLANDTGVHALFIGSREQTTEAAEILAHDLNLPLLRIDLSAVVSKFIGETEKNLERVFADAQATGAVLLFDEADSLFGKRTEVKDSHDRFADIENESLRKRLAQYSGMVIFATNREPEDSVREKIAFHVKCVGVRL